MIVTFVPVYYEVVLREQKESLSKNDYFFKNFAFQFHLISQGLEMKTNSPNSCSCPGMVWAFTLV